MLSTLLGASGGVLIRVWANGLARKRLLASKYTEKSGSLSIGSAARAAFLAHATHRMLGIICSFVFLYTLTNLLLSSLNSLLPEIAAISRLDPWNHVALACIGAYAGYNMESWDKSLQEAVNEKRVERGMPPVTRESIE